MTDAMLDQAEESFRHLAPEVQHRLLMKLAAAFLSSHGIGMVRIKGNEVCLCIAQAGAKDSLAAAYDALKEALGIKQGPTFYATEKRSEDGTA